MCDTGRIRVTDDIYYRVKLIVPLCGRSNSTGQNLKKKYLFFLVSGKGEFPLYLLINCCNCLITLYPASTSICRWLVALLFGFSCTFSFVIFWLFCTSQYAFVVDKSCAFFSRMRTQMISKNWPFNAGINLTANFEFELFSTVNSANVGCNPLHLFAMLVIYSCLPTVNPNMGVGSIFSRGPIVDFSRGSQNIYPWGG